MADSKSHETPFIYNLFPLLLGEVSKWFPHVERAADMGFNWLFLNPINLTGASGSLYSIRDYFRLSPIFFPYENPDQQYAELMRFVERCRERGMEVMVDLVINHTAYDNPLTKDHRNWYKQNSDGSIKSPGAVDNNAPGGYVTWGDLSEIDNEHSSDRNNLYEYWWRVVEKYMECGIRGFRCDAAYQVPNDLWKMLIDRARQRDPNVRFFAESLGCSVEETVALSASGHDFVFNSGKWWNYREDWFLDQLRYLEGRARSITFPESHDTDRLAQEWDGNTERIKQHYLFSALISSGVLMLMGFEYGFRKKPHVVHSNPLDYEGASCDLTDFIREVNDLKKSRRVFCEDNRVERVDSGNGNILALKKSSIDNSESVLLLFNLSGNDECTDLPALMGRLGAPAVPGENGAPSPSTVRLHPWGAVVINLK